MDNCFNCRFFRASPVKGEGSCHRHAPSPRHDEYTNLQYDGSWPRIMGIGEDGQDMDLWCGEHQRKGEAT